MVDLVSFLLRKFYVSPDVRVAINYIFPDEIFIRLRVFILGNLLHGLSEWQDFPLFTVVLSILLVIGAQQWSKEHKTKLLVVCYFALIVSTLTAIPDLVDYYNFSFRQYTEYQSRPHTNMGILGFIDSFAFTQKPSLPLFIMQGLILVAYAAWSAWQITLLNKLRKEQQRPAITV